MPIDYRNCSPNWKTELRPAILEPEQHHRTWRSAANHQPNPAMGRRVVLTIAHLDHDKTNNGNNNLAARCQKCYTSYDAPYKAAARRAKSQPPG